MNTILLFISIIFSLTNAYDFTEKATNPTSAEQEISVIAMYMYADWCGACQAIKPKMEAAKQEFTGKPVLFAKMDMTNDFSAHQSKLLASRLGLLEIFNQNEGKTGFVLLVDANTSEIIGKITTDDDVQGIVKKISDSIS